MANPNWTKGTSGNPAGTSRRQQSAARALAMRIQAETRDGAEVVDFALAVLRAGSPTAGSGPAMHGLTEVTTADKRWAVDYLTDRGWGKAPQTIEIQTEGESMPAIVLRGVTDDDLDAAERVLREGLGAGPVPG
jgi:hypothetical protein